jgi:hypothetical protein
MACVQLSLLPPAKLLLDNLQKHLSVLIKIHESGQKLLRDAADDEDIGWAQEQQRVSHIE